MFIVNLALSDIVMLVFNMPIYLYYIMVNDWVFGRALCHIAYPTFSLPVFVSSWTIMLISLDRCIAAHPGNKYGITRCHVRLLAPMSGTDSWDFAQKHLPWSNIIQHTWSTALPCYGVMIVSMKHYELSWRLNCAATCESLSSETFIYMGWV